MARHELPRLREVRLAKGVGQRRLAEAAHVSRETLHGLEIDGRRAWPRTRDKLAEALSVHPLELMMTDEDLRALLDADRQENELIRRQLSQMSGQEILQLLEEQGVRRIREALDAQDKEREKFDQAQQREAG
jgi:transcriptional regulator with XRE-family HTH domain